MYIYLFCIVFFLEDVRVGYRIRNRNGVGWEITTLRFARLTPLVSLMGFSTSRCPNRCTCFSHPLQIETPASPTWPRVSILGRPSAALSLTGRTLEEWVAGILHLPWRKEAWLIRCAECPTHSKKIQMLDVSREKVNSHYRSTHSPISEVCPI